MADDGESIFAKAGFDVPKASSASADGSKSEPKAVAKREPSIFEAAGFSVPTSASKSEADKGPDTLSRMKAKAAEEGINLPTPGEAATVQPDKSTARKVVDAIDAVNPVSLLAKGAEHAIYDTLEHAASGWQQVKQGISEIRSGQGAPSVVGQQPPGHVTNLLGETREVPGLPQYAPGGYLRVAGGAAAIPGSLVSGPVNALVTRPVTEITGNPDIGDRAGLLASSILPLKGGGKAVEAAAPATKATNALVEMVGPENVPEAVARLRQNPRLTLADVSDPVRTATQGLIDPAQPKVQNLVAQRIKERADSRLEAANSAFTEAMGPAPDIGTMVEGLRQRALKGQGAPGEVARSALDTMIGKSSDPYEVLHQTLKDRSAAAAPLYEKALSRPVAWDERLQEFIDDPVVRSGLAKGVGIQRLESLAEGKPFKPNDYAIKSFNEAGDPVLGEVPNMRTLNVVKKGLDAMVEGAKDSVTGRLSEEGRAIDKVRSAFLKKLDDINPDYKAARAAWAGPSQAQDAFNRGLNIFQNKTGSSGVNSTPQALAAWLKNASQAEQDAVKLGARAAFEQQMKSGADPASRAAALVEKEVNRDKLAVLFGKEHADKLAEHLNFKFEDPIGRSFDEGFDVLKNRSGQAGFEDRPAALKEWMATATPEQVVAKRLGVRADIDQKINGVKNGALAGQTITKIPYNQEKLRTLFGDKEANRLIRVMKDAEDEAHTNAKITAGAKTAETQAGQRALAVPKVEPFQLGSLTQALLPSTLADVAAQYMGAPTGLTGAGLLATGTAAGLLRKGAQKVSENAALNRNYEFARNALAAGPVREETINSLLSHPKVIRELKKRANALVAP